MYLDIRTLGVVAIVICALLGPVALAFGLRHRGLHAALWWGGALAMLAIGLVAQSVRAAAPDLVAHGAVFAFLVAAALMAEQAARALAGRPARDPAGLAAGTVLVLGLMAFRAPEYEALRAYAGTCLLAILMFRTAYAFDRSALPQDGEASRATALIAGLVGIGLVLDAAATMLNLRRGDELLQAVLDAGLQVGLVVALVAGTLSMMWTLSSRLGETLRHLATRDGLTGVLNRTAFMRAHGRELARARRRSDSRYALVLLDVDHLGRINDAFGHAAGDRALRAVTQPLAGLLREYDAIGRLDGDEIGLLLPGTLAEGARQSADRIRQAVQRTAAAAAGLRMPVTVSAAVAVYGEDGEDWDALMAAARLAMRAAKQAGGNRTIAASAGSAGPGHVAAVQPADPLAALRELVDAPRPVGG